MPVATVAVHPAGRAGAVTPSKFCASAVTEVPRVKFQDWVPEVEGAVLERQGGREDAPARQGVVRGEGDVLPNTRVARDGRRR